MDAVTKTKMRTELIHKLDGKHKSSWLFDTETEMQARENAEKLIKTFTKGKRSKFIINMHSQKKYLGEVA